MENPNFPDNLTNYWDLERLTAVEHPILLDEMYQTKAKIIKKLESIQSGKNTNDVCSWHFLDLPESEKEALAVINSVVESLFLKTDVMEKLGPPKKGSKHQIAGNSHPKKLRHDQLCRKKCRDIAKRIWAKDPTITIADMIKKEEIVNASRKKNGLYYDEDTVRNWLSGIFCTYR